VQEFSHSNHLYADGRPAALRQPRLQARPQEGQAGKFRNSGSYVGVRAKRPATASSKYFLNRKRVSCRHFGWTTYCCTKDPRGAKGLHQTQFRCSLLGRIGGRRRVGARIRLARRRRAPQLAERELGSPSPVHQTVVTDRRRLQIRELCRRGTGKSRKGRGESFDSGSAKTASVFTRSRIVCETSQEDPAAQ
jgi:hypothetical protein